MTITDASGPGPATVAMALVAGSVRAAQVPVEFRGPAAAGSVVAA